MPSLNLIGKEKVINHHMEKPLLVLEHTYGFDYADNCVLSITDLTKRNIIFKRRPRDIVKILMS